MGLGCWRLPGLAYMARAGPVTIAIVGRGQTGIVRLGEFIGQDRGGGAGGGGTIARVSTALRELLVRHVDAGTIPDGVTAISPPTSPRPSTGT
jgi:hypothetical protein